MSNEYTQPLCTPGFHSARLDCWFNARLRLRRRLPPRWCPFLNERPDPLPRRAPPPPHPLVGRDDAQTRPQPWHLARLPGCGRCPVKSGRMAESLTDGQVDCLDGMNELSSKRESSVTSQPLTIVFSYPRSMRVTARGDLYLIGAGHCVKKRLALSRLAMYVPI